MIDPRPGEWDCCRKTASKSGDWPKVATKRYTSPCRVAIPPRSAPQSRPAISHSVSSTGCRSKVERLMTLSTSLVAVWYSSDSSRSCVRWRSSLSSRVFSIAMTAWSAKVVTSAICFSVNGSTRERPNVMTPINASSRISGTPSIVR